MPKQKFTRQVGGHASELRKDYIQDKYVIIAPHRGKRPREVEVPHHAYEYENPEKSVFHPKNVNKIKAVLTLGRESKWKIKVIPNKFPAVSLKNKKAYGTQEVVIETPDPSIELEDLPVDHIAKLLEVYAKRTEEIQKLPNIQYVLIFKNDGGKAGASIAHAHSQIFATDFIPPHLLDKSQKAHEYMLKHGTEVYSDVMKKEEKGPRAIWNDKYITCFAPFASMHNYECWIMPRRHVDNITQLEKKERKSFAKILKHILCRINELGLAYNYYFHQVVYDENQHLYMKITPRGQFWAGVEIGSGIIINSISPEDAALFYRKGVDSL
jgi:UDPglucose--hexose-1-phosphate uridylyltransferase